MIYGISKMLNEPNEYGKIFNYKNTYFTDKELLRATKQEWTKIKDNRTKYKILGDINRWYELDELNIDAQLYAPLWDDYVILTDGRVLNYRRKSELQVSNDMVRLNRNGERKLYYISDLLYHAFIDPSYEPELRQTWTQGFGREAATVDSVELKDEYTKQLKKDAAKSENPASPQVLDNYITKPKQKPNITHTTISRTNKKLEPKQEEQEFDPLARWEQGV